MNGQNKKIQQILDEHVAKGVVGCSLAISIPGQGFATYTSGFADKFKKVPMRPDHIFRIASCTKTFIATGIHLLVDDGKLTLDEPISRWFPEIPKSKEMPVRILLNHRSGCRTSRPRCR